MRSMPSPPGVPDLVLLDLMLPKRSGFDVLAAMRTGGADMPVMVVSARGSEAEKVRALQAGADDYVVKPFGLMEVLARVHALLRRTSGDRSDGSRNESYRLGDMTVDVPARIVCRRNEPLALRPKEFALLVALCRARERSSPARRSSIGSGDTTRTWSRARSTPTSPRYGSAWRTMRTIPA